ncbi:hypothetical protein MPH_13405 [Macrophomina phaseolina MS6]|uniref:Uncharacterized protein n=1 Tax=Macrophomina phaseolina (strain MS6) TaxID=1126212 RepID=K2RYS6_MACPH|nr:hypothetical protein MPH_13405 [Macrophomina phaseolina MS6]
MMERLRDGPGDGSETLDQALAWNASCMAALRGFADCGAAHETGTVLLVYFFAHKMVAASVEAWQLSFKLPGPAVRLGSYTIDDEDGRALARDLVLIQFRKMESTVAELGERVMQRDCGGRGAACDFVQRIVSHDLRATIRQMIVC